MEPILDAPIQYGDRQLSYAGFWIRVAAYLIDSIVLSFTIGLVIGIMVVLGIGAFGLSGGEPTDGAFVLVVVLCYLALIVGVVLYFAIMESSERQATFGKMAVGIRVGNARGERISFANALGRYFSKIISAAILYIGFIMIGFDVKNQGLHDKIANTYVFYK